MTKGRKKISDASKRLRGTNQPCRMDGELVPMASASRARVAAMLSGIQKKDDFADFETVDEKTPRLSRSQSRVITGSVELSGMASTMRLFVCNVQIKTVWEGLPLWGNQHLKTICV